jgi:hypothetical protein
MEKVITKKRPVKPTLRKMNVEDVKVFPRTQYSTLRHAIYEVRVETKFEFDHEIKDDCIEVKRVK